MKKIALVMSMTLALGLAACGGQPADKPATDTTAPTAPTAPVETVASQDSASRLAAETAENPKLAQAVMAALDLDEAGAKDVRYYYNYIDLDKDGTDEIIVQAVGGLISGTGGSPLAIFYVDPEQSEQPYILTQVITMTNNPIFISDEYHNGQRSIITEQSGGGAAAVYKQLDFDGKAYPDVERGTPVKDMRELKGTWIIDNDLAQDLQDGKGLTLVK